MHFVERSRSSQVASDGTVYALTNRGVLQRRTERGHWSIVETGINSFQIAPNSDLYVLNERQELVRQKLGYTWMTLQADAQSFTIYSDGMVSVIDSENAETRYASLGPYFVLKPLPADTTSYGVDPPSDGAVLMAANFVSGVFGVQYFPDPLEFPLTREAMFLNQNTNEVTHSMSHAVFANDHSPPALRYSSAVLPIPDLVGIFSGSIIKELVSEQIDAPRLVPGIGLAQMHHDLYRCTFNYGTDLSHVDKQLVIYIDHDHLHVVDAEIG